MLILKMTASYVIVINLKIFKNLIKYYDFLVKMIKKMKKNNN
jgi:hypothetical protein